MSRTDTTALRAVEPPYTSVRCLFREHALCREAVPREPDVPGVRFLMCACLCHQPPLLCLCHQPPRAVNSLG